VEIHGPGPQPGKHASERADPARFHDGTRAGETKPTPAAQRAALFVERGAEAPRTRTGVPGGEPRTGGVSSGGVDVGDVPGTVSSGRPGVSIGPSLVREGVNDGPDGLDRLAVLLENARSVLSEGRVRGEARDAVETLLLSLDNLFTVDRIRSTSRFTLEQVIDAWEYLVGARLRVYLEGGASPADGMETGLGDFREILDTLAAGKPETAVDEHSGRFMKAFSGAVKEFRGNAVRAYDGGGQVRVLLDDALSVLSDRLAGIARRFGTFVPPGGVGNAEAGIILSFFESGVRELERRLSRVVGDERLAAHAFHESGSSWMSLLRKSGIMFEWRLLEWYLSGGKRERLEYIFRDDLKGIVLRFLDSLRKRRGRRKPRGRLAALERDAESVLESITRRQLLNLPGDDDGGKNYRFTVPFGERSEHGRAEIYIRGRERERDGGLDPENFSLTFSVRTSRLGEVNAHLACSGKRVDVNIALGSTGLCALAGEMGDEMRGALESRGFSVRSLVFGVQRSGNGSDGDTGNGGESPGVDISG